MNIDKTLAEYTALLGIIKPYAPEAHIAGGAIRDLLNDRPIKDVDVFVSQEHFLKAHYALLLAGYNHDSNVSNEYFLPETLVTDVSNYSGNILPYPVQLIGLRDHVTVAGIPHRFDFGLNMAAFANEQLVLPDQYRFDVNNRCFTLQNCRSYDHYVLSQDHYDRVSEKYAGWHLVIPPSYRRYQAAYNNRFAAFEGLLD